MKIRELTPEQFIKLAAGSMIAGSERDSGMYFREPASTEPAITALENISEGACDVVDDACGLTGYNYNAILLYSIDDAEGAGIELPVIVTDDYEPTPYAEQLRETEGEWRIIGTWADLQTLAKQALQKIQNQ